MGTMTTCLGATVGGSTSPWSSLWLMMSAPIARHDRPQDVVYAVRSASSSSANVMSKASANDCPRWWLVPPCTDFPSGISASTVVVVSAPGNLSWSGFRPRSTGMPSTSS